MPAGEGFSSEMVRINVSYDREGSYLPGTMIAKFPTRYWNISKLTHIANFYEREIRFYLEVAPLSPIRTPGLIYGGCDNENGRFALLLEDCRRYDLADPDMNGLDESRTRIIAEAMADFHSRWWDAPDLYSFPWMPKKHIDTGGRLFRKCWDVCTGIEQFRDNLPPGSLEAGARIYENYPSIIDNPPQDKLTIQHNDLRSDNIFFDPDRPDNPVVVFDWAMADIERGVGDIAFLLGTSVEPETRRQIERNIVEIYHQKLLENGINDYSLEECWYDYLMALLFKSYVAVIAFARVDTGNKRGAEIWLRILRRWFSAIMDNEAVSVLP